MVERELAMQIRLVLRQLGLLVGVLSVLMGAIAVVTRLFWYEGAPGQSAGLWALATSVAAGLAGSGALVAAGRRDLPIGRREALLLVALSWAVGAAHAALPFWLWARWRPRGGDHILRDFGACYFEAMSGLTTTGSTVVGTLDTLPASLMLWRALTQWLGGLGIVVLFVAVLPSLGVGGKKLVQIESSMPSAEGVRPRIRETARVLWTIYGGLSALLVLLLWAFGMSFFDALCHTFTAISTGGFSPKDASIGAYDSLAIDMTLLLFMVVGGVNFGMYYRLLRGRWRSVTRDPELRLYLALLTLGTLAVAATLVGEQIVTTAGKTVYADVGTALRYAAFNVVAIDTTTGYATADFDRWGFAARAILLALMFAGGCAGSTAGGIKIVRVLVATRVMLAEVERVFRPNVVRPLKVGGTPVEPELRTGVMVYVLGILTLFVAGALALTFLEGSERISWTTAASASAATLNNIGPGFAAVGPVKNYAWFGTPSLAVMSLLMMLGRLEVYAVFALLLPRFWRRA